jgi:hypothetical protein
MFRECINAYLTHLLVAFWVQNKLESIAVCLPDFGVVQRILFMQIDFGERCPKMQNVAP